ncbi:M50 family metallopeptidase [Gaopeijia maritima]|uniref:M50 family metallopeptidase n=1 Tax=Gaopeijia maritima TaxID=3119007 RepID=A0ABU9EBY9_9BACT
MTPTSRRRLNFVLGFSLYFAAVWYLWYTPVIYPLKIFVVLLHEVSHAIALLATGGMVDHIALDARQGGVTVGAGGWQFVTLSAGYLGSLAFGALLVKGAQWKRLAPGTLLSFVGFAVLVLTAVYVRNPFGLAFGLMFGGVLLFSGRRLPAIWSRRLTMALGLTSVLYAILDIKSDVLDRPEAPSDAFMLAQLTGIPTVFWGVLWISLALIATVLLLRSAWRNA